MHASAAGSCLSLASSVAFLSVSLSLSCPTDSGGVSLSLGCCGGELAVPFCLCLSLSPSLSLSLSLSVIVSLHLSLLGCLRACNAFCLAVPSVSVSVPVRPCLLLSPSMMTISWRDDREAGGNEETEYKRERERRETVRDRQELRSSSTGHHPCLYAAA